MPTTDVSGQEGYSTGDYISNFNGTSAACPHAAAVVALMLSASPNLTEEELTELFLRSADNLKSPGRDDFTGHGRINARRAVNKVLNALEN